MEKDRIVSGEYTVEYGTAAQAVELAGTHKVILKTNLLDVVSGDVVELHSADRTSGAVLHEVHPGDEKIVIENPLRSYLGVKKGDKVNIRKIETVHARTLNIEIGETLVDEAEEKVVGTIKSQLIGMPLHQDEDVMILIGNKPFKVYIKETEPHGIVIVTTDTKITFSGEMKTIIDSKKREEEKKISIGSPDDLGAEIFLEKPKVSFDDVGGLETVKRTLKRIAYVIKNPEISEKVGLKPANVFLYGPPGTGKTLLAKAMTKECGTNFISMGCADIESKWVGVAVNRIKTLFSKAAQHTPCILFFDEFDAIAHTRGDAHDPTRDITNQLLIELNEPRDGVFVIAATNRLDLIDEAILRRFHYKVKVGLPDEDARKKIIEIHLKGREVEERDKVVEWLVRESEGLSGSDIKDIIEKAAYEALDEIIEGRKVKINQYHFEKVLREHTKTKIEENTYIG